MDSRDDVAAGGGVPAGVPVDCHCAASAPHPLQGQIDALTPGDAWGVEAVDCLLRGAVDLGLSDLHILSGADSLRVRGRRDGAIFPLAVLPLERQELLIARLKILARLPAFVRHEPQDGRIEWRPGTVEAAGSAASLGSPLSSGSAAPAQAASPSPALTMRISFLPVIHGENAVIRFPERGGRLLALGELGMNAATLAGVEDLLVHREGTLLVTGPSSSGKTTTLYAMLQHLNDRFGDRINLVSIEDPVERDLGFCGQVQVNEAQGVTFDRSLRAALRQDPNALMIGEIRDFETARVAVQAGMTGHLVLSTLHAGRAARVFTRLLSMGVEPYLVASAMTGAVAQRLARVLCPKCRRPVDDGISGAGEAGHDNAVRGFSAPGCADCSNTGLAGRRGVFELAVVTEHLRELILSRATPARIAEEVARHRTNDLVAEGRRLVETGAISRAEFETILSREE